MKDHKTHGDSGIELADRSRNKPRNKSLDLNRDSAVASASGSGSQSNAQWEGDMHRSNSSSARKLSGGLKKRFDSLRKSKDKDQTANVA